MMCNISTLRHRFSDERWRGGEGLNHFPLLLGKSVYKHKFDVIDLEISNM